MKGSLEAYEAANLSTLFESNRSGAKHAITSLVMAGPGAGAWAPSPVVRVPVGDVVVEDGCPILGLFSPAVLGSGEGERGCVLAITDGLLGTAIREGMLLLRLWSLSASANTRAAWGTMGGWPRPSSIVAPSEDAIDDRLCRQGRDSPFFKLET